MVGRSSFSFLRVLKESFLFESREVSIGFVRLEFA